MIYFYGLNLSLMYPDYVFYPKIATFNWPMRGQEAKFTGFSIKHHMNKLFIAFSLATLIFTAGWLQTGHAQQSLSSSPNQPLLAKEERDLHLNTIGAFSAGFVLQSYGYIGVLAGAMSKDVYSPDLVRTMLAETVTYLRNIRTQLNKYQNSGLVTPSDLKFIHSMTEIIDLLIDEAQALSSFAKSKSAEDLKKFEDARKNAWKNIRKTFSIN